MVTPFLLENTTWDNLTLLTLPILIVVKGSISLLYGVEACFLSILPSIRSYP